jgi:hypothetical protein
VLKAIRGPRHQFDSRQIHTKEKDFNEIIFGKMSAKTMFKSVARSVEGRWNGLVNSEGTNSGIEFSDDNFSRKGFGYSFICHKSIYTINNKKLLQREEYLFRH